LGAREEEMSEDFGACRGLHHIKWRFIAYYLVLQGGVEGYIQMAGTSPDVEIRGMVGNTQYETKGGSEKKWGARPQEDRDEAMCTLFHAQHRRSPYTGNFLPHRTPRINALPRCKIGRRL